MAKLQKLKKWGKTSYRVLDDDGGSKIFSSESQARNYFSGINKKAIATEKKRTDALPSWEQKGFDEQFDALQDKEKLEYTNSLTIPELMQYRRFKIEADKKAKRAEGRAQYKKFREEDSKYSSTARKERLLTETPPEEIERLRIKRIADAKYKKDGPPLSPEQEARLAEQGGKSKERIEAFTDPSRIKETQLRGAPKSEYGIKKVESKGLDLPTSTTTSKIKEAQLRGAPKPEYGIKKVESKGKLPSRKKIIRPKTSKGGQKVMINGKWLTADEASMQLLKKKRGY